MDYKKFRIETINIKQIDRTNGLLFDMDKEAIISIISKKGNISIKSNTIEQLNPTIYYVSHGEKVKMDTISNNIIVYGTHKIEMYFKDGGIFDITSINLDDKDKSDNQITFIIMVRNNNKYLSQCIGSLLNQNNSSWNALIISDDSGIVNIDSLLKKNHKYVNNFRAYHPPTWIGITNTIKYAMRHIHTSIVGFLDPDDVLFSTAVEDILSIYNKNDNVFVTTSSWICDKNMKRIEKGDNGLLTFKHEYYYLIKRIPDIYNMGGYETYLKYKLMNVAKIIEYDKPIYHRRTDIIQTLSKSSMYKYCDILAKLDDTEIRLVITKEDDFTYKNTQFKANIYTHKRQVLSLRYHDKLDTYLDRYLDNGENNFNVNIGWNDMYVIEGQPLDKLTLNKVFDHIYVLNLRRDVLKRKRLEKIFKRKHIDVEFFDAYLGTDFMTEFHQRCKGKSGYRFPNQYGYTKTMIHILEDAINKKYNRILVFDDDIIFHKDFDNMFDKNYKNIPQDWHILYFGLTGPWHDKPYINHTFRDFNGSKCYVNDVADCDGSYAMGYDQSIYGEILKTVKKYELPFDTQLVKSFNKNESIRMYAFVPYLIIANMMESGIENRDNNVISNFKEYYYQFKIHIDDYEHESLINDIYSKLHNKKKITIIVEHPIVKDDNTEVIIVDTKNSIDISEMNDIKYTQSHTEAINSASGKIVLFGDNEYKKLIVKQSDSEKQTIVNVQDMNLSLGTVNKVDIKYEGTANIIERPKSEGVEFIEVPIISKSKKQTTHISLNNERVIIGEKIKPKMNTVIEVDRVVKGDATIIVPDEPPYVSNPSQPVLVPIRNKGGASVKPIKLLEKNSIQNKESDKYKELEQNQARGYNIYKPVFETLKLSTGIKILEIGSKIGRNLEYLRKKGFDKLYGIEEDGQAIAHGKTVYKELYKICSIKNTSFTNITKDKNKYDVVFMIDVFMYQPNKIKSLLLGWLRSHCKYLILVEPKEIILKNNNKTVLLKLENLIKDINKQGFNAKDSFSSYYIQNNVTYVLQN